MSIENGSRLSDAEKKKAGLHLDIGEMTSKIDKGDSDERKNEKKNKAVGIRSDILSMAEHIDNEDRNKAAGLRTDIMSMANKVDELAEMKPTSDESWISDAKESVKLPENPQLTKDRPKKGLWGRLFG